MKPDSYKNSSILNVEDDYFGKQMRSNSNSVLMPSQEGNPLNLPLNKFQDDMQTANLKKTENITVKNFSQVKKELWAKSTICFICMQEFSVTVREHHCRACGRAVCSACSGRTINNERACDLCYLKQKYAGREGKRNEQIKMLDKKFDALVGEVAEAESDLRAKKEELRIAQSESMENTASEREILGETDTEFIKLKKVLKERIDEYHANKKQVDVYVNILKTDKDRITDLTSEATRVEQELTDKNAYLTRKNEDFASLDLQLRNLKDSNSFLGQYRSSAAKPNQNQNQEQFQIPTPEGNNPGAGGHYDNGVPQVLNKRRKDFSILGDEDAATAPNPGGPLSCCK